MALQELDPETRAKLEAANGLRQFDESIRVIQSYLEPDRPFALRPNLIRHLQSIAVEGIEPNAGEWRTTLVKIEKSEHQPPPPHLVSSLIEEMCDYVNNNLHEQTPFHLSAYIMWRLNWIHPFSDGNGRTSRIVSYITLNVILGYLLPGAPTIPQQIQENRQPYFDALENADGAFSRDEIDVSQMENLLKGMLAQQLLSVIDAAGGTEHS